MNLETRGVDGYVSLGREGKTARPRDPGQYPATNRMAEKLSKPAGRAAYAERKWLSEAPHGWIKHVLGFRRFSLRGLAKVRGEWDLVCLALNGRVERRRRGYRPWVGLVASFRATPQSHRPYPVSCERSSNRAGRFPAHGSRTGFTARHATGRHDALRPNETGRRGRRPVPL